MPLSPAFDVVVFAGSLGARAVLEQILVCLPPDFPVPIVVVKHVHPMGNSLLPLLLSRHTSLRVREASDGEYLEPGVVYTAPRDQHLVLGPCTGALARCLLLDTPRVNFSRPAADPLFSSAADLFGPRTLAVVLSGCLSDGASGARRVRAAGGVVIVQDPSTCEPPARPRGDYGRLQAAAGMPRAALPSAHFILPPEAIGSAIVSLSVLPGVRAMFGLGGTDRQAA
jgi:two-component system chemotaxis response regulator CheB